MTVVARKLLNWKELQQKPWMKMQVDKNTDLKFEAGKWI